MGNFIISPHLLQSGTITTNSAMKYYQDVLPDKTQASVISARYIEINNSLSSLNWDTFLTYDAYYMTKTAYNTSYNYMINLYRANGGNIVDGSSSYRSTWGHIRGVMPLNTDGPIIWNNDDDLKLSVLKDGNRILVSDTNDDLSQYDEIEGIYVSFGNSKFIIKLHNEQSGKITKESAMALYSDILPDKEQATIISLKNIDINDALRKWNGDAFFTHDAYYMTKTAYNTTYNYMINLYRATGGNLLDGSSSYKSTWGYIRGVIVP